MESTQGDDMNFFWRAGAVLLASIAVGCDPAGPGFPQQRCRSHATRYASSGPDITNGYPNIQTPIRVDCALDRDLLERSCTAHYLDQYGTPSVHTQTVRYASIADFVDEASPVGRVTAISVHTVHEGFDSGTIVAPYLHAQWNQDTDYIYDEQGRIINQGFDSWDQAGRPLSQAPTGICTADTGRRLAYDDTARTVTIFYNTRTSTRPPDGSIPCIPLSLRWTFDDQGNPTAYRGTNYSVEEVEEVCVETD